LDITSRSFTITLLKNRKWTFPIDTGVFSFSDKIAVTLAMLLVCTDGICKARYAPSGNKIIIARSDRAIFCVTLMATQFIYKNN